MKTIFTHYFNVISQRSCGLNGEIEQKGKLPLEKYAEWTIQFLNTLSEMSIKMPTYLNDSRTLLLFRRYEENEQPLSIQAKNLRLRTLLQLWLYILSKEMKDSYLDIHPKDFIENHSWAQTLIDQEISSQKKKIHDLNIFIKESCKGEGMFACPECHSKKNVRSRPEQRRRADEGMTTINYCLKCHKTWQISG